MSKFILDYVVIGGMLAVFSFTMFANAYSVSVDSYVSEHREEFALSSNSEDEYVSLEKKTIGGKWIYTGERD